MDRRYRGRAPGGTTRPSRLHGPVVGDLLRTFVWERWNDPAPLDRRTPARRLAQRLARMPAPAAPRRCLEAFPDPPAAGRHGAVQVLRTYARKRPAYPLNAPGGERSIARGFGKAFGLARSLVYIEDQYLWWPGAVVQALCDALRRSPDLRVLAVVPRYPDADTGLSGPANRLGPDRRGWRGCTGRARGRVGGPRRRERRRDADLRPCQGLRRRRRCGCGSDNVNRDPGRGTAS